MIEPISIDTCSLLHQKYRISNTMQLSHFGHNNASAFMGHNYILRLCPLAKSLIVGNANYTYRISEAKLLKLYLLTTIRY